jgi:4a-hydroxytetrahydrobiopterin dehydratase
MIARRALSPEALKQALETLDRWSLVDGKLHREFSFPDFVHAFGFMAQAALRAEAMDHHPEWSNVYGRVVVDLVTHTARGITELDVRLARSLDEIAG